MMFSGHHSWVKSEAKSENGYTVRCASGELLSKCLWCFL